MVDSGRATVTSLRTALSVMVHSPPDDIERDTLFKTIVAEARDMVVVLDAELDSDRGPTILYVNEAFARYSGRPAKGLVGRPFGILYPPEALPPILAQMRDAKMRARTIDVEVEVFAKNRRVGWLDVRILPILDEAGEVTRLVRIGRDVTARRRAETERHSTELLLASVFGVIDQGLAVIDAAGCFAMVNLSFTRQLGWAASDLLGKPFTAVVPEEEREELDRLHTASLQAGTKSRQIARLLHKDGATLSADAASTIIRQDDGRRYRVVSFTFVDPAADPAPAAHNLRAGSLQAGSLQAGSLQAGAFEMAVRRAVDRIGAGPEIVAGKLQFVGLAGVRAALGGRWPAMAERAFTLAETILRRHLSGTDVFSRTDDDGFLVCFSDLDEAAADFKARVIAREIRDRLVGEIPESVTTLHVTSLVSTVRFTPEESAGDDKLATLVDAQLARDRARHEENIRRQFAAGLTTARVRFQRVWTEANHPAPMLVARLPVDLDTTRDAIRLHMDPEIELQADLLLLKGAARQVSAHTNGEIIVVPMVAGHLLNRRERERWLDAVRPLGDLAKHDLVIELSHIDKEIGHISLAEITALASTFFRRVALELPGLGSAFVGGLPDHMQLATIPARYAIGSAGVNPATPRLIQQLAKRRYRLLVKDVASATDAEALAAAGVTLMSRVDKEG
jgi:PAS domain S-box-containing protein